MDAQGKAQLASVPGQRSAAPDKAGGSLRRTRGHSCASPWNYTTCCFNTVHKRCDELVVVGAHDHSTTWEETREPLPPVHNQYRIPDLPHSTLWFMGKDRCRVVLEMQQVRATHYYGV